MRIIGKLEYQFGGEFDAWFKPLTLLHLVRFYMGSKAGYHNLLLLLGVFDPSGAAVKRCEDALDRHVPLIAATTCTNTVYREVLFGWAHRAGQNAVNGFLMRNYLDALGVRTHLVLSGRGRFVCEGSSLAYAPGDLVMFDGNDFGRSFRNEMDTEWTRQLVTCWANKEDAGRRNWKLFAEYEKARGVPGARD